MTNGVIYYIIDTNVLIQCRALGEIDWRGICDVDEVHLIISRPVQSEIDDQKNKGGERIARRARKASTLIRDVILSNDGYKVIQDSGPRVILFVNPALRPAFELSNDLDYGKNDDQIVGIVHTFACENPDTNVLLLTHDTGPIATAKMAGVPVMPVPDEWLLPPEPSESDRKLRTLEAEIAKLKDQEPRFSVHCVGEQGQNLSRFDFQITRYSAIPETEISELVNTLKRRMPVATDFGSREWAERENQSMPISLLRKEVYEPAKDAQIEDYNEKYQNWLKDCDTFFRSLHDRLNRRYETLKFQFLVSNDGSRPANDALVTFCTRGALRIMPPPDRDDNDEKEKTDAEIALPLVPKAPQGQWKPAMIKDFSALLGLDRLEPMATIVPPRPFAHEHLLHELKSHRRDPNGFYFKPQRPRSPVSEFSLECEQWRHGIAPEAFPGLISFEEESAEITGAIECNIHAENISAPITEIFPVKINVQQGDTKEFAQNLISRI